MSTWTEVYLEWIGSDQPTADDFIRIEGNIDYLKDRVDGVDTIFNVTVLAADWTGSDPYTQAITVTGLLATDTPIVEIDLSGAVDYADEQDLLADYGLIYRAVSGTDQLTLYAIAEITNDLALQLKVVR